jgi:hypothetical protein
MLLYPPPAESLLGAVIAVPPEFLPRGIDFGLAAEAV